MKKIKQSGFTLIELLVVIAIIGILAAVVLASLGTARQRARDTAGQATLSQVRAQAELDNTFDTLCGSGGAISSATTAGQLAIDAATQAGLTASDLTCYSDTNSYAVSLGIAAGDFCVDSSGYAGDGNAGSTAPYTCS